MYLAHVLTGHTRAGSTSAGVRTGLYVAAAVAGVGLVAVAMLQGPTLCSNARVHINPSRFIAHAMGSWSGYTEI